MTKGTARTTGWICLLALALQACATTGAMDDLEPEDDLAAEEIGRDVPPPWEVRGAQTDEEARRAEATSALSGMRGVASHVEQAGTELVFRFWAHNGALTLLAWRRDARGAGNNIWTAFRRAKSKAAAEDVRKVADIVDRHFGRWFNQRHEVGRSASAPAKAEADALDEVKALVDHLLK
ncbi:hypothetical protein ACN28E_03120 [Archangium lansingense]|uniref:hypothetical protein n=1 Tax=Archangium lansingense TaxID=2995310 RepID=UPI003B81C4C4